MKEMPLISIIMPVYNAENYIENSLKSAIGQTYPDIELIIVNDGSEDDSLDIAKGVLKDWNGKYQIINQENIGHGAARNNGLKASNGEWVCFLDADDILSCNAIEDLYHAASDNEADVVFSDYNEIHNAEEAISRCKRGTADVFDRKKIQMAFLKRKLIVLAPGTLYNRQFLKKYNLKFEKLAWSEDQYFIWQVLLRANKVVHLNEKLYQYLRHQGSIMSFTETEALINSYKRFANIEEAYLSDKTIGRFLLPRWTMGTLNSAAAMLPYSKWKKLADSLEVKENFRKLLLFPDFKVKMMSLLCGVAPKTYYNLIKTKKIYDENGYINFFRTKSHSNKKTGKSDRIFARPSYYIAKFMKKIQIPAVKNSKISKKAKVCSGAHVVNCSMDKYSYIGNFSSVINCEIGSFCSIADNCEIGGMSHPMEWVSTSPVMYEDKNCLRKNFTSKQYENSVRTVIGNDVWISGGVRVRAGVKISTGAVIGMGSVLTKDVGPYEIWAGNPARLIRKRFSDEIIEKLLKSEWWTWDDKKIYKYSYTIDNPEKFCEVIK